MIRNYFITAIRNLWRNKSFAVINIAGLSVGLASCMLIFLYAMDEVSYDRFHVQAANIYQLVVDAKSPDGQLHKFSGTGDVQGPVFKSQLPEVQCFVRVYGTDFTVKRDNEVFDQTALFVDSNFLSVFTFPLLYGKKQNALSDPQSIILSEETAEKYFGHGDPVGKTLQLKIHNIFQPFTVTAVTKQSPQNSSIKIKMLVPQASRKVRDGWLNFFQNTFLIIKPGSDIRKLSTKINQLYLNDAESELKSSGSKDKMTYKLQPFLAMHTSTDYPAGNGLSDASKPTYSYILIAIALFILAIACMNFVNLTVARSLKRGKEIGIRKVFGGQRTQLIVQFLGESLILSFIAFMLAIALVQLALPFFNTLTNKALAFSYLLSWRLVSGYIGIFLLSGLLAGFYPALVLSGFKPVQTLYNRPHLTDKKYLSKGLVILQFTLATFLIIATITIYTQFNYLMHFDLGYNADNVVSIRVFNIDKNKFNLFKTELAKAPNIYGITADQGGRWGTEGYINGSRVFNFDVQKVDEDYLPLFQVPVLKGRNFSRNMAADSANSVLVSEQFVKEAGWKDPIGQTVDFFHDHKKYTVVGVVRDYHYLSLLEKPSPILYSMNPDYPWGNIFVRINPHYKPEALDRIQKEFKADFPFIPYQYQFKEDELAEQYDKEARWKQIVTFGAALTIFISCIGLFGLATLSAEHRKKEIGIRKVLGASVEGIVRKLSADFAFLIVISAAISTPAAWWAMQTWLQDYPYRIHLNVWIFLFATVFVLFIAMITLCYQTIKAAAANPVQSLRNE
ncbi:ABC transporter permease [Mucilaginibacter sp. SG564]|uniref:ABC transporter permease n=1 Tax=Mucilaginibacter sp. SG564 TaxID=2587022 RepID=UPI00155490FF|nr:ABC transporter permease [Mucilaginibacter sp. SG564]NOW96121.1 putative ABC transport system permease protein [Mucilaginibacter sp. SG564]